MNFLILRFSMSVVGIILSLGILLFSRKSPAIFMSLYYGTEFCLRWCLMKGCCNLGDLFFECVLTINSAIILITTVLILLSIIRQVQGRA